MIKEDCKIGVKIKLTKPLKSLCCDYIIKEGTVIEIISFNSLHGNRKDIIMTRKVVIKADINLHHVKISSIQGEILK